MPIPWKQKLMPKDKNKAPPYSILLSLLEHYEARRYEDAERLAISITQQFPNHQFSWKVLGSTLRQVGRVSESLFFSQKAIQLNLKDADAHNNLGNILNDLGRLREAEASYRQAIELNPKYAMAHNNLGNILNNLHRPEEAEASYRQAIILKPNFSQAHYGLGLLLYEAAQYEEASEYFKGSNFENSKHYLLRCLYRQDKKLLFYDQLDYSINQGEINPTIGSLVCRSELRYGIEKSNLFCKDPLNYIFKNDLSNQYDFEKIFVKTTKAILNDSGIQSRGQTLLTNGYQTSGNLFDIESDLTDLIQKTIRLEVEKYRTHFKDSNEGFIKNWPNDYTLYGWVVSMQNGGQLAPHMHDRGWLSGSIYINVPPKLKSDSGNLVVCIDNEKYETKGRKNQKESIDVVTGSLCLFPASLLHYTIPFESEEERVVLAFDVVPK